MNLIKVYWGTCRVGAKSQSLYTSLYEGDVYLLLP